jgi:hypothetical protein
MEIELSGTVRGEPVAVRWRDGQLDGSDELLRRVRPLLDDGRCDVADFTSVVRNVEMVAGQRMKLRVLDERLRQPSRVTSAA